MRLLSLVFLFVFSAGNVLADGYWRRGQALPDARAGLAAVELEGRIYAAGGAGLTEPSASVEEYNPSNLQWREIDGLPRGLERFGFAALDGRLYVAGGYAAPDISRIESDDFETYRRLAAEPLRPIADMWSFDPNGGVWQSETPMPGPMSSFQLVALDGRLFAVGGDNGSQGVFIFDPSDRSWAQLEAPSETARRGAAAVALDGRIYLIGGVGDSGATSRVDVFNPQTGEWTIGPALPEARAGHAATVVSGGIHVLGGRSENMTITLSSHIRLDPNAGEWVAELDMPQARTDAAAIALDGEIYVLGGGAGGGFFAPFTTIGGTDIFTFRAD